MSFDPTPDLGPVEETKPVAVPAFGAGNSETRPASIEEADTRLPSERFHASQSERMRAAADRHFASVEGGAV